MTNAIATIEQTARLPFEQPMTARDIRAQVNLIQEVMKEVMQSGQHYGTVPGCGDKPTLLQPGAHKLLMIFRLVADPDMTIIPMQNGHREVRCKVKVYSQGGLLLGAGVGTCSTMEGKYRFRTGPVEFTEKPVPREYWDLRQANPAKAKALLGEGMVPKKDDAGRWVCARQGEKVEHDNPADYYNTVEKMAYKRALVSATLTVTAASDIFTQDVEDMPEVVPGAAPSTPATPQPPAAQADKPAGNGTAKASEVLSKMKERNGQGDGAGPQGRAMPARPTAGTQQASDAPTPSAPTSVEPALTGTMTNEGGLDVEWLSQVLDAEDVLRGTLAGKGMLRSIRQGFHLQDGAYPLLPQDQADYLSDLRRTVDRMHPTA